MDGVFFNISHSDNLVVCAVTTHGPIGLDVEKQKQVTLKNFEPWFTEKEWTQIINSSSPIRKFYWYWTRKESILKALGVNLSYLNKIEIDSTKDIFIDKGKEFHLMDLDFGPEFLGAICSGSTIDGLMMM